MLFLHLSRNQYCIIIIQTAEAVRLNRFGPPRHGESDFDSPDYRRARSCFRSNRANDSNSMALESPSQNNDDIILIEYGSLCPYEVDIR